jgi:hypothetical protein
MSQMVAVLFLMSPEAVIQFLSLCSKLQVQGVAMHCVFQKSHAFA